MSTKWIGASVGSLTFLLFFGAAIKLAHDELPGNASRASESRATLAAQAAERTQTVELRGSFLSPLGQTSTELSGRAGGEWFGRGRNTSGLRTHRGAVQQPWRTAMIEEMKKFQGTWRQIAYEKDGSTEPLDEQGWEPRTTIVGDRFVVTLADGRVAIEGTFKLDPATDPKQVDWTDTFGEDAGKTFPAIYEFKGDRLTFCAADDSLPRPTEFKTRPGWVLRVLERESP